MRVQQTARSAGFEEGSRPQLTRLAFDVGGWRFEWVEEQYGWDLLLPELVQLFVEPWDEPLVGVNRRQSTTTPLAMRALRRTQAVDMLFRSGYYWESHALIRSAYEDWLELARAAAFSGRIDRPYDSNSLGVQLRWAHVRQLGIRASPFGWTTRRACRVRRPKDRRGDAAHTRTFTHTIADLRATSDYRECRP